MKAWFGAILALVPILAAGPAWSQAIVSQGIGKAHDCFVHAKTGDDPRGGAEICSGALRDDVLSARDKAATYDNRGVILDRLGKVQDAAADFHAAIRLDATLGDPYVNLGSMLIKERRLDEALVQINKGMDLGMSFPHVGYYDRAVAEQLLGRYREAYYDYKKVLELEPHFAQASERLKDFKVIRTPDPG